LKFDIDMSTESAPTEGEKSDALVARKQKLVLKAKLIGCAYKLVTLIDQNDGLDNIKAARDKHNEAKDAVIDALLRLIDIYEK